MRERIACAWTMHTLSATMGPLVALVSAAIYGVYDQQLYCSDH